MSPGIRRTVIGAAAAAVLLVVMGLYSALRGLLPFGILFFALAACFAAFILRIFSRVWHGDDGVQLATGKWAGEDAGLLISWPLATADDLLRKYLVVVDGRQQAQLGYGEAAEVHVPPGLHTVRAILGGSDKESDALEVTCVAGRRNLVIVEPYDPSAAIRRASDQWLTILEQR